MKIVSMTQLVSRMQNLRFHYRQLEQQFALFLDGAKAALDYDFAKRTESDWLEVT